MNIVAAFKVVPDDQDIQVSADGSLDYSKAKNTVSAYDLNAIEAAAQLAAANEGSKVIAMTVGGADIDDSKLKKNVLARGVDELYMTADAALADLDANAAAGALAELVAKVGGYDVIPCGDGSADNYAQQVDVQLAATLGLPVVHAAPKITAKAAPPEVAAATGIQGRIIRHLASIDYWFSGNDRRVHKVVHHYLMGYESGTISVDGDPDHEAEAAAWVPLRDVSRQLAYPNERRIVRIALDLLYRDSRG